MGQLVEGKWHDVWYDTKSTGGHFKRMESQFRNWVTPNGEAGPARQRRIRRRAESLSSLCFTRLPLGAPHPADARAERSG
ncbi:hypothetical protein ACVWVR_001875 [Ewingella americana]